MTENQAKMIGRLLGGQRGLCVSYEVHNLTGRSDGWGVTISPTGGSPSETEPAVSLREGVVAIKYGRDSSWNGDAADAYYWLADADEIRHQQAADEEEGDDE